MTLTTPVQERYTRFSCPNPQLLTYIAVRPSAAPPCDHGLLRSSPGGTLSTSVEEGHAHDKKASKCYCIYWFFSD